MKVSYEEGNMVVIAETLKEQVDLSKWMMDYTGNHPRSPRQSIVGMVLLYIALTALLAFAFSNVAIGQEIYGWEPVAIPDDCQFYEHIDGYLYLKCGDEITLIRELTKG